MARSSSKKEQLTKVGRELGRLLMKKETKTRPKTDPCGAQTALHFYLTKYQVLDCVAFILCCG